MRAGERDLVINGRRFKITKHAVDRMCDMCVNADEIVAVLRHPEHVYLSLSRRYRGHENWTLGRITLPLRPIGKSRYAIPTVLWSSDELWQADLLYGPPTDRVYRPGTAPVRNYS